MGRWAVMRSGAMRMRSAQRRWEAKRLAKWSRVNPLAAVGKALMERQLAEKLWVATMNRWTTEEESGASEEGLGRSGLGAGDLSQIGWGRGSLPHLYHLATIPWPAATVFSGKMSAMKALAVKGLAM